MKHASTGWIYFQSERDEQQQVFRVRPDGGAAQSVMSGRRDTFVYRPNHTGDKMLFVAGELGQHDIFIADSRGESAVSIAAGPGQDWYPRFSPDNEWVLFESGRQSYRDLYRVKTSGGKPQRLTHNREGNFDGAWSPDGKKIVFSSSRTGQLDLFVMNADGSAQRRLTSHPGESIRPVWRTDNETILFISARDGHDAVYRIQSDGRGLKRLTPRDLPITSFALSPDETQIAYAAGPSRFVYVYTGLTGENKRLTAGGEPCWSPDGSQIVFSDQAGIHVIQKDGSNRKRITDLKTVAWRPLWFSNPSTKEGSR